MTVLFYKQCMVLSISLCILVCATGAIAQTTQSFDIITFQTPNGWQTEVGENSVQIGIESAEGTCFITIFKSIGGTDSPRDNFDYSWNSIVYELVEVKAKPEMQPAVSDNGWTAESGFAIYESDGKKGVVMLTTSSGRGKMVNILVFTDTDAHQQELDSFFESIALPGVEVGT